MPRRYDVRDYIAGDTLTMNYTLNNPDGSAMDLTAATIKWGAALVTNGKFASASVEKTVGDGITVTNAVAGQISVDVDAGDITAAGLYYHELEVVVAGQSLTMCKGTLHADAALYTA